MVCINDVLEQQGQKRINCKVCRRRYKEVYTGCREWAILFNLYKKVGL